MTAPLFILPFDHRTSFARDLLGATYPVRGANKKKLVEAKNIIFDALLKVKNDYRGDGVLATIIDEEFGAAVIRGAKKHGVPFALTTEAPGHETFRFLHGASFGTVLKKVRPTFAKALVYYTVGDATKNKTIHARLKKLSDFCEREGFDFMLELLIQNPGSKAVWAGKMIDDLQAAGVRPTIWKIEAVETVAQWKTLKKRTKATIILLGRGESTLRVDSWIKAAAKSSVVGGFAVGRTVFLKPLQHHIAGKLTRSQAVDRIAKNYLHCIRLWERSI